MVVEATEGTEEKISSLSHREDETEIKTRVMK